jgi:PAS domain S-box-containing protein
MEGGVMFGLPSPRRSPAAAIRRRRRTSARNPVLIPWLNSALIDNAPAVIYALDNEGRYITVNRLWESLLHLSREQVRGKTVFDIFPQAVAEQLRANEAEALAAGAPVEREETIVLEDGPHLYLTLKFPLRDDTGAAVAVGGISVDITGRKRAEEELRQTEERFRLLVEGAHDSAIMMLDPEGRIVSWNTGAERISGYTADEIIGRHIAALYPNGEAAQRKAAAVLKRAEAEGTAEEEGLRRRKDGSLYRAAAVVTALRNSDGSLRGFARITRDISRQHASKEALEAAVVERTRKLEEESLERQRVEQALRRREEYYRYLIENGLEITGILAADGTIRYISPAVQTILGYSPEQLTGGTVFKLIHPEDIGAAEAALQRVVAERNVPGNLTTYRVRAKDGAYRVLEAAGKNLLEVPSFAGILMVARDVTSRALAEERLRESRHFIQSVAETVPDALYVYDVSRGRVVWANRTILDLLPEILQIGAADLTSLIHPDDSKTLAAIEGGLTESQSGGVVESEFRLRRGEEWRWMNARMKVLRRAADGSAEQIVGTAQDVTARKQAEQALTGSTNMLRALAGNLLQTEEEERKALSRELHDDLNQRLAVIAFELDALGRDLPSSRDETRAQLGEIQVGVGALCEDVRRMAHQLRPSILDDLGLIPALRSYCADFSRREDIGVVCTQHGPAVPMAPDVALCLYRVTQEGLRNVAKHSGSRRAVVRVGAAFGQVWLFIRDYGAGFDSEEAAKKGGLGIISMRERVRLATGRIVVRSRPGAGTRIAVRIPSKETTTGESSTPPAGG